MTRTNKNRLSVFLAIGLPLGGIFIGRYLQLHLKSFGVTFITLRDIMACYSIPVFVLFALAVYLII